MGWIGSRVYPLNGVEGTVSDKEPSPKKIKVVDRRWFDESGELRVRRPAPASKDAGDTPAGGGERNEAGPARAGGEKTPEPRGEAVGAAPQEDAPARVRRPSGAEFSVIVDVLAQQAAVFLTGAQGVEKNLAQARLFIDLLDILQQKTTDRLAPEEARYLRDVLAQLQLAYVESGP